MELPNCFVRMTVSSCILTDRVQEFQLLCSLATTWAYRVCIILTILIGILWYRFICISLLNDGVDRVFMCWSTPGMSPLVKCLFRFFLLIFNWIVCFLIFELWNFFTNSGYKFFISSSSYFWKRLYRIGNISFLKVWLKLLRKTSRLGRVFFGERRISNYEFNIFSGCGTVQVISSFLNEFC